MSAGANVAAALAGLALLGGCETGPPKPHAELTVLRDKLEPGQAIRRFDLETYKAFYAPSPGGWRKMLLGFPLPGARPGVQFERPVYYLFVRFHAGPGTHRLTGRSGQEAYLIEAARTPGEKKALWLAREGVVRIEPGDLPLRLVGNLELTCTDGTRLRCSFDAVPNAEEVENFEKAYLPDEFDAFD